MKNCCYISCLFHDMVVLKILLLEPEIKHIKTVFNASSPCTSTNQKVEARKFEPIRVKKEFLVSDTDYTTSWYKLNGVS